MPTRKVAQIIGETPALRHVVETSRRTDQLQRVYLVAVPAELSRFSRIAYARGDTLIISAGNGAIAAKLRQLTSSVLAVFRQQGCEFNSIRIVVQVGQTGIQRPFSSAKPLTRKAIDVINAAADQLTESPLKAALKRLGRNRETPT